jgi:hypothetical protein
MAFDVKSLAVQGPIGAAQSLTSAAVVANSMVQFPVSIEKILFKLTTAVVSSGAVVVNFKKRPTLGSATGEVSIGTLTIPAGAAINAIYYKDVTPVEFGVGEFLAVEVTTAAAGMGAAGAGYSAIQLSSSPKTDGQNSNMIASA